MKIVVFIKAVLDAKVPLECVKDTGRIKENWNMSILNPDDEAALAAILGIKQEIPKTHVTVVHLGPPSEERFIRDAIALGCDEGLRIWDEGMENLRTPGKILIFSRVAKILGFDLLVSGAKSLDNDTGQLGLLLAASLRIPCVTRVMKFDEVRPSSIVVTRNADQGFRQRIESHRPLVVTIEWEEETVRRAPFPAVVQAWEMEIPCFDLARIGVPQSALQKADSRLVMGPLSFPTPRPQFLRAPDSASPPFERRVQLERGMSEKRAGTINQYDVDSTAKEIFQILLSEGWLDHLRKETQRCE